MTTTTATASDPTRLIIVALARLMILLFSIIKLKVQAVISILAGVVAIGLVASMSSTGIISSVSEGIESTLKGVILLVGLNSIFDSILKISGSVRTLAVTMVKKLGDKKVAWALGITRLVVAMPVSFDVGFVILIPLALSFTRRTKRFPLFYAIPLLADLAIGHIFISLTPGPILVATMLGVDLGWTIMVDIVCGIFAMIVAGPIWGTICGNRYDISVPEHIASQEDLDESKFPKSGTIVGIISVPLVLIILNSIARAVPALVSIQPVLGLLDEPFVAPTIATVVAMFLLGYCHGYSNEELEKTLAKSLEPTGLILLVAACGDVLRLMLQNSGLSDVIDNAVSSVFPPIVVAIPVVTILARIPVGPTTVAVTMATGTITAMPEVATLSPLYLVCVTTAVAGGATACSHFNDSGSWLVKSLVGLDEKTTLKTWTVVETLVGGTGFIVALIASFFV